MTTTPPDNAKNAPPFNVRRWFVAVGLVAILLVNAGLAYVLSNYVFGQMMRREGQLGQEFLGSVLRAEGTADRLFAGEGHEAALKSFADHVLNLPGLLRANVYSPDLVIRFSTQSDLVGSVPEDTAELIPAFAGEITTTLKNEVGDTIEARSPVLLRNDQRVVESYLPILQADGSVVAVVEFYRDAQGLKSVITHVTLMVWAAAGLGGLLIFAALYAALTRGTRIILAQTRELQGMAVLASLGQMAQAVAHSLRNPLASIRSSVELIQIQHPATAPTETADVIGEVDRITHHINDLLDFSRSGGATAQPIELGPLLAQHLALMQPRLDRHAIALHSQGLQSPLRAAIEPRLFGQVIDCILTNAMEAMAQGGEIVVALSSGQGRSVVVEFRDTGPGIAPEVAARLPEPFLTTKVQGLGLGLSICKRILEQYDGSLAFAANRPQGTRVTVTLPAA